MKNTKTMTYFLRFTNTPEQDLERKSSIHASDLSIFNFTLEQASEILGCDIDSIVIVDDFYCQLLDGLCGYLLDSKTLEEAIEEIEGGNYQFAFVGNPVIFSGKYLDSNVPDGDLFIPFSIVK